MVTKKLVRFRSEPFFFIVYNDYLIIEFKFNNTITTRCPRETNSDIPFVTTRESIRIHCVYNTGPGIHPYMRRCVCSTTYTFIVVIHFVLTKYFIMIYLQNAMKAYYNDIQNNPDFSSQVLLKERGISIRPTPYTMTPQPEGQQVQISYSQNNMPVSIRTVEAPKPEFVWHQSRTDDGSDTMYYWNTVTGGRCYNLLAIFFHPIPIYLLFKSL